ncbi:MAG TPA: hypothetical protein VLN26_03775, partial [Gaiellaceae bacterium]|nr:hypothetical protein [Gaiellaceae bacterium]
MLSLPTNNALDPGLLAATRTDYAVGYVVWGGTLDETSGTWTLTATGYAPNPTGATAAPVRRRLGESVGIQPSYQQ